MTYRNCLGLITAVSKAFDNGKMGKSFKWVCALGGYNTGYQCSFKGIPYFEIKSNNTIEFLNIHLMQKNTGLTPEIILDYLNEKFEFERA